MIGRRRTLTDRDLIAARPTDHVPKGQPMTAHFEGTKGDLWIESDEAEKSNAEAAIMSRFVRVPEDAPTLADARPIIDAMVRSKVGRQALAEAVAWTIEEDKVRGGTLKAAATWLRMLARGEKR